MTTIRLLNEAELREAVRLDLDAVACIEEGFRALATRLVVMPSVLRLDLEDRNGEVDVKTAYVPGIDSFAIKISPGFFDNPKLGLPSLNGLMVLFSANTGLVEAVLFDNGYLTDLRTAAAGAVAAKWLAREDARTAGIIGTGAQARLQLQALTLVREIRSARIWGRDRGRAATCAEEMAARLGIEVTAAASPEEVVRASEIVVTTTPSTAPLVHAAWLQPGQHVTAMGSDAEHKHELAPDALRRADVYVCDRRSQAIRLGELHHAVATGVLAEDVRVPELGQVIAGQEPGRTAPDQITIADLTGTGVQDTAIATLARARADAAGAGITFTS